MRHHTLSILCAALAAFAFCGSPVRAADDAKPAPASAPTFELKDGDRVVLLGNTLVERAQRYGYIETALSSQWPGRNVMFRNLGWSADDVWANSWAGFDFDNPIKGYQRMVEHVTALKPTVIVLGYGGNESFAGEAGLSRFRQQLDKLVDDLKPTGARFVVLSPNYYEPIVPAAGNGKARNEQISLYADALRDYAHEHGYAFIDLFDQTRPAKLLAPLTDDGMHLTPYGYYEVAFDILREMGWPAPQLEVELTADGKVRQAKGATVADAKADGGRLTFQMMAERLPSPPAPTGTGYVRTTASLRVKGLPAGRYVLHADGKPVAAASADDWAHGVWLHRGPDAEQAEALRQAIMKKNKLYFYRWRPQNITYLFLFRKHEQGQNAKEIPEFDPLVEEQETLIAKLRAPVSHQYELVKKEGGEK
jgi:lysophospholipase L1-like esterase